MAKFKVDTSTIKIGERLYRAANIAFIEQVGTKVKQLTVTRLTSSKALPEQVGT